MARPKKIILIVDPVEDRQAVTRFVLSQSGFPVLSAPSVYAAAEVAHSFVERPIDLLLGYAPVSDEYLIELAGELKCEWLFIGPEPVGKLKAWPCMEVILDRIKIKLARKRGPQKGFHWVETESGRKMVRNSTPKLHNAAPVAVGA